jgi:hypothetical protein
MGEFMNIFDKWKYRNIDSERLAKVIQGVYSNSLPKLDRKTGLEIPKHEIIKDILETCPEEVRQAPEVVMSVVDNCHSSTDIAEIFGKISNQEAVDKLVGEPRYVGTVCTYVAKETLNEQNIMALMECDFDAFSFFFKHIDLLTPAHVNWIEERGIEKAWKLEGNEDVYLATLRVQLKNKLEIERNELEGNLEHIEKNYANIVKEIYPNTGEVACVIDNYWGGLRLTEAELMKRKADEIEDQEKWYDEQLFEIPTDKEALIATAKEQLGHEFREYEPSKPVPEEKPHAPADTLAELIEKRATIGIEDEDAVANLEVQISIAEKTLNEPSQPKLADADKTNSKRNKPNGFWTKRLFKHVGFDVEEVYKAGFEIDLNAKEWISFKPSGEVRSFNEDEVEAILSYPQLFSDLNPLDRYGFMQGLGQSMAKELGIECLKIYMNANPFTEFTHSGLTLDNSNFVVISPKQLNNLPDLVNTLAHEMRHEWQKGKYYTYADKTKANYMEGPNNKAYTAIITHRYKIGNKTRKERKFQLGYLTTPAEVDARRWAREYALKRGLGLPLEASTFKERTLSKVCTQFLKERPKMHRSWRIPVPVLSLIPLSARILRKSPAYKQVVDNSIEFLVNNPEDRDTSTRFALEGMRNSSVMKQWQMLNSSGEQAHTGERKDFPGL